MEGWWGRHLQVSLSPALPCTPHPGKASQGEQRSPREKRTAMKWDLRWLLGSLRVFLSVKGNKGKDDDTGGRERMEVTGDTQMR